MDLPSGKHERSSTCRDGRPHAGRRLPKGVPPWASGERAAAELLERAPDPDAVFAASDLMAQGVLAALRRSGRRVPSDAAGGGFDDSPPRWPPGEARGRGRRLPRR
ncbi:substrate-binding domain-containing protein, partial [Streptomyces sparsogenes]